MNRSAFALTPPEREKLVKDHMTLVRTIAAYVKKKFNLPVALEELISDGHAGLMEAVNRFNPAESASFSTFAGYRIRGAILDGVRRMTFLPRAVYRQLREARAANEYLQSTADQPATPESQTLESRAEHVESAIAGIATVVMLAIDGVPEDELSVPAGDDPDEDARADPLLTRRLARAVATLKPAERAFLRKVYVEDKIFAEVANETNRSRSWVTRQHQTIVAKLRDALGPKGDEGA